MKKVNVVFEADSEMSGTYSPKCFEESFTGDLSEKVWRLYSNDDRRQVEVDRWSIRPVDIPDWMTESLFIEWNWYVYLGFLVALTSPEFVDTLTVDQFKRMRKLDSRYQYFVGWLWERNRKAKKENAFLLSIEKQVFDWLNGENDFSTPLSWNQWLTATEFCPLYEADKISERYYWMR